MNVQFLVLILLVLMNTIAAQADTGNKYGEIICAKGNDTFSSVVDLRIPDEPLLWGLRVIDGNDQWSDGYPVISKLVKESNRCKNISSFKDKSKITFLCAGELFMLTNIYGQIQISNGAENVLSEVLLKESGWACKKQ